MQSRRNVLNYIRAEGRCCFFLSLVSLPEAGTVDAVKVDADDGGHEDSDATSPGFTISLSLALCILGFSIVVILVALRVFYMKKIRNVNVSVSCRTGTISTDNYMFSA